jgi:hypothetical protein
MNCMTFSTPGRSGVSSPALFKVLHFCPMKILGLFLLVAVVAAVFVLCFYYRPTFEPSYIDVGALILK